MKWLVLFLVAVGCSPARAAEYDELLRKYVAENGVRYEAWHASTTDREALQSFIDEAVAVDPSTLDVPEQLAYWINLYNALTLDLILDHYPVASIRDIEGPEDSPWNIPLVTVNESELSLDAIEHEIIRPTFGDPRIHFAVNCAARSCPPLRAAAFTGKDLDTQLDEVTRRTLNDPAFVASTCGEENGVIRVSKLFEWYAEDWDSVRAFLARYRDDESLLDEDCPLETFEYDWSLNLVP